MELRRFDDAATFSNDAREFLLAHEAEHNLILGICMRLVANAAQRGDTPYLATVQEGGAIVAAAVMTPPRNLVLSLAPLEALPIIAADVATQYATLPGVTGTVAVARAFAENWQQISSQAGHVEMAMRIYQLTTVRPVLGVPGEFRRAEVADRDLLIAWTRAFEADRIVDARLHDPDSALYLWEDGQPVSMAGQSGPTPNGIRVNAVYTPPEYRGRGYASACVAALSQHLLDRGYHSCFLFTDLRNPTSNRIYQAIGYTPVCDVDDVVFLP